jgi:hypothetical protein
MSDDLEERLVEVARRQLAPGQLQEPVLTLAGRIERRLGHCLEASLLYGSRVMQTPLGAAGRYDFLAVVTSYADAFPGRLLLRLVSHVRTPDLFIEGAGPEGAVTLVILAEDLERAMGTGAADLRRLGRFGRRMVLVRARDEAVALRVARCQARAITCLSRYALATLPEGVGADPLARRLAEISYEADWPVDQPEKIEKLAGAAPGFFREVASVVLQERPRLAPAERARLARELARLPARSRGPAAAR